MSEGFPRIELMVVWCPASQGPRARSRSARPRVSAAMFYGRREHAGVPGAESPSLAASPWFSEGGLSEQLASCNKIGAGEAAGARALGVPAGGEGWVPAPLEGSGPCGPPGD